MGHLILGRKGRMTQVFTDEGVCIPVTILEAGPCKVTQVKTESTDGYNAVQLAFEPVREKVLTKPQTGHCKKAGVTPHRYLREHRTDGVPDAEPGADVTCDVFEKGAFVDVVGTAKGRGTAGAIKRHGFARRPQTHGHMQTRRPGSIGMHSDPSRVFKGKRMAGHYGANRNTVKNLEVVLVDKQRNLLLVKGAVPGPQGGFVLIQTARTAGAR